MQLDMTNKKLPRLKICFLLLVDDQFYTEREIAMRLQFFKDAASQRRIDTNLVEGTISITYNWQELLGTEFTDVIDRMFIDPDGLLKGRERKIYLPYQTFSITLQPKGNNLIYHAKSHTPNRKWDKKWHLPFDLFIKQWTLMYFRYLKLLAYLTDKSTYDAVLGWKHFMSKEWQQFMGEENMRQIMEEDLQTSLLNSDCQRADEMYY